MFLLNSFSIITEQPSLKLTEIVTGSPEIKHVEKKSKLSRVLLGKQRISNKHKNTGEFQSA